MYNDEIFNINMTNILLCTLDASWAVVPEVYGFISPERLSSYLNHPNLARDLKSLEERIEQWLQ